MKIWIVKAVIQKNISFLPFKHQLNYLFQKYVTKGVLLTDYLMDDKLTHCKSHLEYFYKYSNKRQDFTTLEIGTGWYPIVPLGFYLAGAGEICTIDISNLLKAPAIRQTIQKFQEYHNSGKLANYLPQIDLDRLNKLGQLLSPDLAAEKILGEINIHTVVGDARKTNWPDGKFDLINSNNTFEHIYPEILSDILKEFKRLLKPDGVMSHFVDLSDHFAHLDKSITPYNFLRFSEREWSLIDNSIQPQNRLRISDYRTIYKKLDIPITEEINRPGSVEALRTVKLSNQYLSYPEADVAVTHSLLISTQRS